MLCVHTAPTINLFRSEQGGTACCEMGGGDGGKHYTHRDWGAFTEGANRGCAWGGAALRKLAGDLRSRARGEVQEGMRD